MGQIFDTILAQPMGFVMDIAYRLIPSYMFSLFILTLVIKLLMYPLGVRTQKSQLKQMRVKPREAQIRKKYANDKEKMNQEVMALYKSEGVSMTGGCLPMLLQLPIIWALYQVINKPLTFILKFSQETIEAVRVALGFPDPISYSEIALASAMNGNMDKLAGIVPEGTQPIDFNVFGMSLSEVPSITSPSLLWLIPLLAAGTALIQMLYTQKNNPMTMANELMVTPGQEPQKQPGSGKMMMLLSPVMSLVITFTLPAGIGVYWTLSNGFALLQSWLLNKLYNPHKALAEIKEEMARAPKKKKKKKKALPQPEDDMYDASPDRVRLIPVDLDDEDMYDASPERIKAAQIAQKKLKAAKPADTEEPADAQEPVETAGDAGEPDGGEAADTDEPSGQGGDPAEGDDKSSN